MKNIIFTLLIVPVILTSSCDLIDEDGKLSTDEIIEGLKTALTVGTDSSVTILSASNGYYQDMAVRIFLPEQANVILDAMEEVPAIKTVMKPVIDELILTLNRAAEDAASEAGPIFRSAITSLTISDGWEILNGKNPAGNQKNAQGFDSIAATNYLISTTRDPLVSAFSPKINTSLDKKIVHNISANDSWDTFTTEYNKIANNIWYSKALSLVDIYLDPVDVNLSEFVTGKALDGLFLKVGDQERMIRHDPLKWAGTVVENILERVFGNDS